MKRVIIPLVLVIGILAIGIFVFQDYLKLSGIGSQPDDKGRVARPNQESKTTHPRVEAHRFLDQETPAAVVYEWIPYYYRHPRPQETAGVVEVLLSQEKNLDPAHMGPQIHFFATILHEHQEELQKLKANSFRYSGKQLQTITAIVRETENYEPIKEISPENLDSLWAEYMVTGNKGIIRRIIQKLAPSESDDSQRMIAAIQESFYRHLPRYSDAYRAFNEACENTPGALGNRLEEIKKVIHETLAAPANMHLLRADNHIKQREYGLALDEFEASLKYFPDYQNVFINVAYMYEQLGKLPEAMAAMKKAVQIDSTNPSACYGMGRQYFKQGKYDEAINWESKALQAMPKNPFYVHAIARSYQNKGDTVNAVKYFQQYLEYAPNGEHVELVKRYLASVKVSVPGANQVPVAGSNSVFYAFQQKDFGALEKQFAAILQEKKQDRDGYSLLSKAYDQICDNPDAKNSMEKYLGRFEDWLRSKPSSHFANAAFGRFYVRYAWHARGTGWANTITKEGSHLFEERLLKARYYLEKAYLSDSSDPLVPSDLITVARGLGSDFPEMEKQFQRAMRADRTEYRAYEAKLTYLMPKWYGSQDLMFSFARETARNAPANSLAPLVLAQAHWEMYYRSENRPWYFRQPEVWYEVKSVYSTLCRRFPQSKERHNWFARTAYLAGDFKTAKQELAIIKDDWSEHVWSYAGFIRAKQEILSR